MDNPDPTKFITILDHKAALQAQQAEFDKSLAAADKSEELAAKDADIAALSDFKSRAEQGIAAVVAVAAKDAEIATLTARIDDLTAIPETIANWRAKASLALAGLIPAVELALDSMPEPGRTVARYAWDGGADFARTGPTVLALAAALGLTDEQLDAMFTQAAILEV